MVTRIGMIGRSEGNGHPFSFSSIINGYLSSRVREAGWPQIADYLDLRPRSDFGVLDLQVTHAWTQDFFETKKLCEATLIERPCQNIEEMFDQVEGVIIARDDWESHFELAKPFLDRQIPVFIDKPLTLDLKQLDAFSIYLENGSLMSCSGFRLAEELRNFQNEARQLGEVEFIDCIVVNDYAKYGIHMLEAVSSCIPNILNFENIEKSNFYQSFDFYYNNDSMLSLTCLRTNLPVLNIDFYFTNGYLRYSLKDNFRAFKSTLDAFGRMVATKIPPIEPRETIALMNMLVAISRL